MRIYWLVLVPILLTGIQPESRTNQQTHSKDTPKDSLDLTEDIRKFVAELPKPGTSFRAGSVSPTELIKTTVATENGYRIQLPHQGLTPTPTAWKDLILVSGGFGSEAYYAFKAETGEPVWAISISDDGPSTGAVSEGVLVFNTESCTLFAVDARTGKHKWSWFLGDPLMSSPCLSKGKVFTAYPAGGRGSYNSNIINQQMNQNVQAPDPQPIPKSGKNLPNWEPTHVLAAFDLQTGAVIWQHWLDGDIMTAPVAMGEELVLTTFPGTYYRFNTSDGTLLEARASRATSAPTLANGQVFFSRRNDDAAGNVQECLTSFNLQQPTILKSVASKGAVYLDEKVQNESKLKKDAMSFDAGNGFSDGAPAAAGWQKASANIGQSNVSSLQAFQGSRVFRYGQLQFATMGDSLFCTNDSSEGAQWKLGLSGDLHLSGGSLGTPPFVVGGQAIVGTLDGRILLLNAKTGELSHTYSVPSGLRYPPIAVGGNLYATTLSGELVCIRTSNTALTGWTTLAGNAARTNQAE